jgi:hypothetical protein
VSFDLSGSAISRVARFGVPRFGVPSADVVLVETPTLAVGSRVVLNVGDVAQSGTLRPGGSFGGTAHYTVLGGAGRWDAEVPAKSYSDPAGVKLSQVLADLARATRSNPADATTGETVALDVPDRSLGTSWTRDAGLASEALDALTGGQWYVATDGVTHVGTRPLRPFAAPPSLTVPGLDASLRLATIRLSDDALAALLPGCVLTAEGLPDALTIGSIIIRAEPGNIEIEAFGEKGPPELLADLIASLRAGDAYARLAPMQVAEVQGSTASAQPVPGDRRSVAIPGVPLLPQAYGVPGCSAVLQAGAPVVVAWLGADPGSPAIVLYPQGAAAVSVALQATGSLTLNAPAVTLGGPAGSGAPVVTDTFGALTTYLTAVSAALAAAGHPVGPPPTIASATTKAVP